MAASKVLFVMGCPRVPIPMSKVLYLSNRLSKDGNEVTLTGTDVGFQPLRNFDPEDYISGKHMIWMIVQILWKRGGFRLLSCIHV
ncbi:MAG: DUF1890 family protein [Methanotrichaceae archaeon]|nr:DUF1890 family protein [Methanotrichaceae archaeon]